MKNSLLPVPNGTKVLLKHLHKPEDIRAWFKRAIDAGLHGNAIPIYATLAILIDKETGEVLGSGTSYCSPRDNPSRKLGRLIAHNRAILAYTTKPPEAGAREVASDNIINLADARKREPDLPLDTYEDGYEVAELSFYPPAPYSELSKLL